VKREVLLRVHRVKMIRAEEWWFIILRKKESIYTIVVEKDCKKNRLTSRLYFYGQKKENILVSFTN
jgi:hypothetical protein